MISGLLWFDDDPRKDAARKIGEAAERYLARFGVPPTVCRVHAAPTEGAVAGSGPAALPAALVAVVPDRRVRPHHFWLGQDDAEAAVSATPAR